MDDQKLVGRARNGDERAFEKLYSKYIKMIYGYIYNKVGFRGEAEDITSEIWMSALTGLEKFRGISSFKNWLFGIAKHKIMDYYQAKYRLKSLPLVEEMFLDFDKKEEGTNEDGREVNEKRVMELLNKLPEREKKVLKLRFLKGYTTNEIAKELGLSAGNVKVIQHRAIKRAGETFNGQIGK